MKIGDKFGRWTVTDKPFLKGRYKYVSLACECGTERMVRADGVKSGKSKSCGCFAREQATSHSQAMTRRYHIWFLITSRCTNPSDEAYKNYGARGITVCDRWRDPKVFCDWAEANGYQRSLTLDRINNGKGYSPENCRWATRTVQAENRQKFSNNTSGFIGVQWFRGWWVAKANKDKKQITLGHFDTPEEAARVRDAFVKKNYTSPTLNFSVG